MTSKFCGGCITCQNIPECISIYYFVIGDVVKYFLYVYQPDASEGVNMSQESGLGNSSVECEADGGWYCKALEGVDAH